LHLRLLKLQSFGLFTALKGFPSGVRSLIGGIVEKLNTFLNNPERFPSGNRSITVGVTIEAGINPKITLKGFRQVIDQ